jgi:hypothetical protein
MIETEPRRGERCRTGMRKLLAFIVAAVGLAIGAPTTSSAGGWVVVSLDSAPTAHAGEDVEVGFTVLRHGTTPESSNDLAIVLTGPDGRTHRFEAVQEGAVGHHVATITLPDAGDYRWEVTGQFVAADLGRLEVTGPPGGTTWTWDVVQWGSATSAVLLAGLAAHGYRKTRRHRRTAPAPA